MQSSASSAPGASDPATPTGTVSVVEPAPASTAGDPVQGRLADRPSVDAATSPEGAASPKAALTEPPLHRRQVRRRDQLQYLAICRISTAPGVAPEAGIPLSHRSRRSAQTAPNLRART